MIIGGLLISLILILWLPGPGSGIAQEEIQVVLHNSPLRQACDLYEHATGKPIQIAQDVHPYQVSLTTNGTIRLEDYEEIFTLWLKLHGLILKDDILQIAEDGLPDFSEKLSVPASERLQHTLQSLAKMNDQQIEADFDNSPLLTVLRVIETISDKTLIRGPLPQSVIVYKNPDTTASQFLSEIDKVLIEQGIIMMDSGSEYLLVTSASPAIAKPPSGATPRSRGIVIP